MEGSEVDDPLPSEDGELTEFKSSIAPLTWSEQLDAWASYYMAIGIPYEEFWHGDYCHFKYYVEADRLKRKKSNEKLWLQGMYVYEAFGVTLGNAFGGNAKYTDKPYDVVEKTEREKEIEIEEAKKRVVANLNEIKRRWDMENSNAKHDSRPSDKDNE